MKTEPIPRPGKAAGILAALAVAVVLAGCHRADKKPAADDTKAPAGAGNAAALDVEHLPQNAIVVPADSALHKKLMIGEADEEEVRRELAAPGVIEADPQRMARVYPPVTGHLQQIYVQLGEAVVAKQLLATLSSPDFMQAQSDFVKARSQVNLTERALKRQQTLLDARIAAQSAVEQAQADADAARGDLEAARGRLNSYGFDPDKEKLGQPFPLYAPVSGKVVDMATGKGEFRNDPTAPLMTIADLSEVWLTASVQEKDIRYLTVGQEVSATFSAYPDETFTGKVLYVGEILDPDTRATKVRISIQNPTGHFKPGMFATVNLKGVPEKHVTVPTSALVQIGKSAFVYVLAGPNVFVPREVRTGEQHGERIVIEDGLQPGTPIVTNNAVLLQ